MNSGITLVVYIIHTHSRGGHGSDRRHRHRRPIAPDHTILFTRRPTALLSALHTHTIYTRLHTGETHSAVRSLIEEDTTPHRRDA